MAGSITDAPKTGNKGPQIMAVMWSMTTLATFLVIARLCVRQRMLRNFGFDDWLIGASMVIIPSVLHIAYPGPAFLTSATASDIRSIFRCNYDSLSDLWVWTTQDES